MNDSTSCLYEYDCSLTKIFSWCTCCLKQHGRNERSNTETSGQKSSRSSLKAAEVHHSPGFLLKGEHFECKTDSKETKQGHGGKAEKK